MIKIFNLGLLFVLCFPLSGYANNRVQSDEAENAGQTVIEKCWNERASHADATNCAFQELERLEKKLEKIYNTKIIDARKSDSNMRKAGSEAYIYAEEALTTSQKNFKLYMESECDREVTYMLGGSYGGDIKISCEINFIRERIKLLERINLP